MPALDCEEIKIERVKQQHEESELINKTIYSVRILQDRERIEK